jgi:hypothetical protein
MCARAQICFAKRSSQRLTATAGTLGGEAIGWDGWKMAMGTDRCVNARESRREWPEGELPLGP